MLFNCPPPGFDTTGQLQIHSDDSEVSYEKFTRFLTAAVLAKKEGYEYHQQRNLAKPSSSEFEGDPWCRTPEEGS
ncbi:hypothetical protein E4U45_008230 [Claviceps purpurea]|nr:hypothetical protein E4U45_008230 [Claviceps purpurea]